MRLPRFDYFEPVNISQVQGLLSQYGPTARILAGGTDLLVSMKQRIITPKQLINLRKVPELNSILYDERNGLRVGATTTLESIESSRLIQERFPILAQAASKVASIHIRNRATIGGNIGLNARCWYYNQSREWRRTRPPCFKTGGKVCHEVKGADSCWAIFSADVVPALIALKARIKVISPREERLSDLADLYTGKGDPVNNLKPDEFMAEVQIPSPPSGSGGGYVKHAIPSEGIDFPLVGVAAMVTRKDGVCQDSRIVITGIASAPFLAREAEKILKGKKIAVGLLGQASEAAAKEARPIPFSGVTAAYKRKMIQVFVERALKNSLQM